MAIRKRPTVNSGRKLLHLNNQFPADSNLSFKVINYFSRCVPVHRQCVAETLFLFSNLLIYPTILYDERRTKSFFDLKISGTDLFGFAYLRRIWYKNCKLNKRRKKY
jgi:hypothetical protein